MSEVRVTAEGFTVDAALLSKAFAIDLEVVQAKMRAGEITSLCETGIDDDAGRFRLTFHYKARTLRLTVDAEGAVVSQARFDVKRHAKA